MNFFYFFFLTHFSHTYIHICVRKRDAYCVDNFSLKNHKKISMSIPITITINRGIIIIKSPF